MIKQFQNIWILLIKEWSSSQKWDFFFLGIVSLSVLIQIWAWFPGCIGSDVFCQYLQAIGEIKLSDWHPPVMAWFWRLEIYVFKTANLLDATWIILVAVGLSLFLFKNKNGLSIFIFLLIFFSPVVGSTFGILQKDFPLAYLLLIAAGILYQSRCQKVNRFPLLGQLVTLILLILCILLRFNSVFAVAPLFTLFILKNWEVNLRKLGFTLGIVILSLILLPAVNHRIFHAKQDYPETSLQLFDLGGIARYSSDVKIDREQIFKKWDQASTTDKLNACYYSKEFASFGGWSPSKHPILYPGYNQWSHRWISGEFLETGHIDPRALMCIRFGAQIRASPHNLSRMWFHKIKQHPAAYLEHRWKHFSHVYLFSPLVGEVAWGVGYYPQSELETPYHLRETWIIKLYHSFIWRHPYFITNWAAVWLMLTVILFVYSLKCEEYNKKFVNVLSCSALMYALGYFFVGVGMDFRYIYPTVILDIAALLVLRSTKKEASS